MPMYRVYDRGDEYFPAVKADYAAIDEKGVGFYTNDMELVAYFYSEFIGGFQTEQDKEGEA